MNRPILTSLIGGLAFAAAGLAAAPQAAAIAVGDQVQNVLTLDGKDVPLPAGQHTVVEIGFAEITQPDYGPQVNPSEYGPVRRVVLARIAGDHVADVIEIVTNTVPHPDGWGTATDCTRGDIYATLTRYKSGWDVSCLWIKPIHNGESTAVTDSVGAFAEGSGASLPDFWIEAGFRVSNRHDLVDVRYRFAATEDGQPVSPAQAVAWQPAAIGNQPEPLARVQSVAEWASTIYPSVETGLRLPLAADSEYESPFAAVATVDEPSDRTQRLAKLTALHEAGTIDEAEYARQKTIIEAEVEPPLENAWSYSTVAGYKAFTYRVAVTTINAGIDYIFIGQPFAAGVLVVLQVVVNTTKFFFHEVMWQELFGVGPLQRENPRVMDFVVASAAKP